MISAQTNYHLNKETANSTVEFVNNMLHPDSQTYLSSMNPLSHVSKMCSSLSAHWPTNYHHHHQSQPTSNTFTHTAAAAAAALAAGHNIDSILGSGYKIDDKMNNSINGATNKHGNPITSNSKHKNDFNNSYDGGIISIVL